MFLEVQEVACKLNNETIVNAYYNVEAAKKIKKLLSYLPLWSGMVDKFIFYHIEYLDGKLKLTSGEANQNHERKYSSKYFQ